MKFTIEYKPETNMYILSYEEKELHKSQNPKRIIRELNKVLEDFDRQKQRLK